MILRAFFLLLLPCFLQETSPAGQSRRIPYQNNRLEVILPVSGEKQRLTSVLSFPEEALEFVVLSWTEESLSIEKHRGTLFLKLLQATEGDLHVLGASGTLYRLYVRPPRTDEKYDAHLQLTRPLSPSKTKIPALDLIRAMRLGEIPPRTTVRTSETLLHQSNRQKIRVRYIYDSSFYLGVVAELQNTTDLPLRLDPSRFHSPDLVLIGAHPWVVPARHTTRLYLVLWK